MGCTLSDASHFFEVSQGLLYNSPYQSLIREMLPASLSIKSMREPYEVMRLFYLIPHRVINPPLLFLSPGIHQHCTYDSKEHHYGCWHPNQDRWQKKDEKQHKGTSNDKGTRHQTHTTDVVFFPFLFRCSVIPRNQPITFTQIYHNCERQEDYKNEGNENFHTYFIKGGINKQEEEVQTCFLLYLLQIGKHESGALRFYYFNRLPSEKALPTIGPSAL